MTLDQQIARLEKLEVGYPLLQFIGSPSAEGSPLMRAMNAFLDSMAVIREQKRLLDAAEEALLLAKEWITELRENEPLIPAVGDILDMEKIDTTLAQLQQARGEG